MSWISLSWPVMWKGDPYRDPQTEIFCNRSGLSDQVLLNSGERKFGACAFAELVDKPLSGGFDQEHLQAIHRRPFEEVYFTRGEHSPAFAWEILIVGIEKYAGIDCLHPDHLVESLKARLDYAFDQLVLYRCLNCRLCSLLT